MDWERRGHCTSIEVIGDREEARPLPARLAFEVSQQSAEAQLENIQRRTYDFVTTQGLVFFWTEFKYLCALRVFFYCTHSNSLQLFSVSYVYLGYFFYFGPKLK